MNHNSNNYILLTGATGYLGSYLLRALIRNKYPVVILKRKTSNIKNIPKSNLIKFFDIQEDLSYLFKEIKNISIVIHLSTCYGRNNETKKNIYDSNFFFPAKLFKHCEKNGVDFFINCDSALPRNLNYYSKSKNDFYCYAIKRRELSDLKFINMKMQYFFGPGDDINKFPSMIIDSCIKNEEEIKLSQCEQVRDFIYIDDVVDAFICILNNRNKIIKHNLKNEFEIGLGKGITLRILANMIKKITSSNTLLSFGTLDYRKNEIMNLVADNRELKKIGWMPKYSLKDALIKVVKEDKKRIYKNEK